MNSILRFATDTTLLGVWLLGLSLAVVILSQAMHAGFRFVAVEHLPLIAAIPLALLYPLAGPARLIRHLHHEHRNDQAVLARAASMAAHPSNGVVARAASMAAHPSGNGRGYGSGANVVALPAHARHLHLIDNHTGDVA